METDEFRNHGKALVDYMCRYVDTLKHRSVSPDVQPNYLQRKLPSEAPFNPDPWEYIMDDFDSKIMPGILHWNHPRFHAYFPSGNSYPSILGDMLSNVIACLGISWTASPACTELETIVLDWMGQAIGLPEQFLTRGNGGGVIQGSASECILVTMLAARNAALTFQHNKAGGSGPKSIHLHKLVAYCSIEAHSCVEKAANLCLVQIRKLVPDNNNSLTGAILERAINQDENNGLVPFFVCATLGSTGCCSFDNVDQISEVARPHGCWFHIDAAYAGSSFICPENRDVLRGIEYVDSFNTNTNKWFLTNFDCSCLWVTSRGKNMITDAFTINPEDKIPEYLKDEHQGNVNEYRNWCIPSSRRFRALKLWFVMRTYGVRGLQEYIRKHIRLAKYFESLVKRDERFEVLNQVRTGLVCFRLRSGDQETAKLLANINQSRKLHMISAKIKEQLIIRFCVCAENATTEDIDYAWNVILSYANASRFTRSIPSDIDKYSFTRRVPRYVLRSMDNVLWDEATPVLIADD